MRSLAILAAALLAQHDGALAGELCPGDCNGDGIAAAEELNVALSLLFDAGALATCAEADANADGAATAADVVRIIEARALLPVGCSAPVTSTWTILAPLMEGARQEVGAAALGDALYVLGGFDGRGRGSKVVERYDSAADAWTRVADLPVALQHVGAAALDGRVYCVGGFIGSTFQPSSEVFVYDPGMNQWASTTPLPGPRGALAAVALDGRIHAVGGNGPSSSVTTHTAYDPVIGMWAELEPFPGNGRNHLAAVALGGQLYVVGGRTDGGGLSNSAALDRYDPVTDAWTSLEPMPTARSGLGAAVVAGQIVVVGGEVNPAHANGVFPQVELYDPSTDRWMTLDDMPVPRHGIYAVAIGARVHVAGGATAAGFGASAYHDALTLGFD